MEDFDRIIKMEELDSYISEAINQLRSSKKQPNENDIFNLLLEKIEAITINKEKFNWKIKLSTTSLKDYWDSLYFHGKVLKKCLTCSRIPRISPTPWFNVVASLEKLCQAVVARNKQGNLQPTLSKRTGGASLPIFVTDCFQNLKKIAKGCLETQKELFEKVAYL